MAGFGALQNVGKEMSTESNVKQMSFSDMGYPSNLSEEDKIFIIQRMMELGNSDNNPYLSGDTGLQMLLKEKYGM
jgi:hypothetical protein|tara:strand:+ start:974 stop:1198 length:225 start_codon:yes stop_codon:yes gene_type:complete